MDDGDYYGPHYLADLLHALSYSGADVVGKQSHYMHVQIPPDAAIRGADREHRFSRRVMGPTIMAHREVFEAHPFQAVSRGRGHSLSRVPPMPPKVSFTRPTASITSRSAPVRGSRRGGRRAARDRKLKFYGNPREFITLDIEATRSSTHQDSRRHRTWIHRAAHRRHPGDQWSRGHRRRRQSAHRDAVNDGRCPLLNLTWASTSLAPSARAGSGPQPKRPPQMPTSLPFRPRSRRTSGRPELHRGSRTRHRPASSSGGELIILESTSPPGATRRLGECIVCARPDLPWTAPTANRNSRGPLPGTGFARQIMIELVTNDRIVGGITSQASELAKGLYSVFCQGEILLPTT